MIAPSGLYYHNSSTINPGNIVTYFHYVPTEVTQMFATQNVKHGHWTPYVSGGPSNIFIYTKTKIENL